MVRLADLPDYERNHLLNKDDRPPGPPVWVDAGQPLAERRIALITTGECALQFYGRRSCTRGF